MFFDIVHFFEFEQLYGEALARRVIELLRNALDEKVSDFLPGTEILTVDNLWGDDFVVITSPERAERLCRAVVRCFSRTVRRLYSEEDRSRGTVCGLDRNGKVKEFPLVSVSMGIIDCAGVCDARVIAQRAAEVKLYAKTIPGSNYVRDRRGILGHGRGEGKI